MKTHSFSKIEFLFKEINSYINLPENWDGYGAIPLSEETANKIMEFIFEIPEYFISRITEIYPSTHSTVHLEFENENNITLHLEIGKNSASYFYNNEKFIGGDGLNSSDFINVLYKFYNIKKVD
jgi:hypothetical protein